MSVLHKVEMRIHERRVRREQPFELYVIPYPEWMELHVECADQKRYQVVMYHDWPTRLINGVMVLPFNLADGRRPKFPAHRNVQPDDR